MNKPVIDLFGGVEEIDNPRVDELTIKLEERVAQNPTDMRSLLLLGNGYYLQGKIAKSMEMFNRATALNPDYPYPHYYIGIAQYRSAHITEAIEALTRAVTLAPSMVMAYYWLGIAFFHCGRYAEARQAFETLLQKNHESHIAHYHAAVICMFQRDFAAAAAHLEALVSLGSQDPQVFLRLGNCQFQLHKITEALAAYRAGLKQNPDNAPLKEALAELVDVQSP
jgi:cytochrome c-type biogenesis protein CcmH/NrfG